jgi:uncharacterized protein (DUF433 family)
MTTATRRWTIVDLEGFPDDDGNRYEIIDGELHVTTAPHVWRQIVVRNVEIALGVWSQQSNSGLTIPGPGVIFSPSDAVIPDVVWVSRERFAYILGEDGKLHAAPDLAVEVLAPGTANEERDRITKRRPSGLAPPRLVPLRQRSSVAHRANDIILVLIASLTVYRSVKRGPFRMNSFREAEQLLAKMTRAEKAQLLQWVVRDLGDAFPGIESNAGVAGGEPCIVRTRIPVWVLVQARRLGTSEADLLHAYPTLRAEDLANAWAYYRVHHDEIDLQIAENEAA